VGHSKSDIPSSISCGSCNDKLEDITIHFNHISEKIKGNFFTFFKKIAAVLNHFPALGRRLRG
jgi:hypothetical protein